MRAQGYVGAQRSGAVPAAGSRGRAPVRDQRERKKLR